MELVLKNVFLVYWKYSRESVQYIRKFDFNAGTVICLMFFYLKLQRKVQNMKKRIILDYIILLLLLLITVVSCKITIFKCLGFLSKSYAVVLL